MLFERIASKAMLLVLATLGVSATALAADSFQLGVCIHVSKNSGAYAAVAQLLDNAQLTFRDDVFWGAVESQKDSLQYPPQFHDLELLVDDAVAHHRRPLLILDFGNKFYDNGDLPKSQAAIEGYARYVSFIVKYFKGRVSQFEVWNEWNGGMGSISGKPQPGDSYVPLLKAAYTAIKQANPSARVIGGVLSWTDQAWLEAFAKAGGLAYVDAISVHPYVLNPYVITASYVVPKSPQDVRVSSATSGSGPAPLQAQGGSTFVPIRGTPESAIQNVDVFKGKLDSLAAGKQIPIFISEMGWPTSATKQGVSDSQAAAYAMRFLLMARARPWIAGVWWYELLNDGGDPGNNEDNYGLLSTVSSPKAGYPALVGIADMLLSGKQTTITADANGVMVASGYASSGKVVKVAWLATNVLDAKAPLDTAHVLGGTLHAVQSSAVASNSVTFMPTLFTQ